MKIDAVAVTTTDMSRTIKFYSALGFEFSDAQESEDHVEATRSDGGARLMIDTASFMKKMMNIEPRPANHSSFAILMDTPQDVSDVVARAAEAGGEIVKEPWDASWGQRYAIVRDPDGYMIDLFAPLS